MAQTRPTAPRGVSAPLLPTAEYKGTSSPGMSVRMGTASSTTPSSTSSSRPATMRTSLYALDNSSNEVVCKRGFCFAASTGPTAGVKAVLKSHMPVEMSSTEFGNLPPAIQRKYFSSMERLRYAQQSSSVLARPHGSSPAPLARPACNRSASRLTGRESTDSVRSRSSHGRPAKLRRHRKSESAVMLSQTNAQWFLDLPETIQRKQFSPEERTVFARQDENVAVDTDRMEGVQQTGTIGGVSSPSDELADLLRIDTVEAAAEADIAQAKEDVRRSFRWMDEDGDLDLRLRHFQDNEAFLPPRSRGSIRATTRRTMSMTSKTRRDFFANRPHLATIRKVESESDDTPAPLPTLKPTSPLVIDLPSMPENPPSSECPATPPLASPREIFTRSSTSSTTPLKFKPILDPNTGLYLHSGTGHREVTVRMTLTRKDLRGDAESIIEEKVPLAELRPSDISTIDWDALDKESATGFKRLWRKVKGT